MDSREDKKSPTKSRKLQKRHSNCEESEKENSKEKMFERTHRLDTQNLAMFHIYQNLYTYLKKSSDSVHTSKRKALTAVCQSTSFKSLNINKKNYYFSLTLLSFIVMNDSLDILSSINYYINITQLSFLLISFQVPLLSIFYSPLPLSILPTLLSPFPASTSFIVVTHGISRIYSLVFYSVAYDKYRTFTTFASSQSLKRNLTSIFLRINFI